MGFENPRFREIFYDLYAKLPRAGPGDDASTARALAMCSRLPEQPLALDVGCGPGRQTLVLARHGARVIGLDNYPPFLARLRQAAHDSGVAERVSQLCADMAAIPLRSGQLDLIWSEGAAYQMGTGQACARWRPLLRPGGYLALTDACRLGAQLPDEVRRCWEAEGLELLDGDGVLRQVAAAGYEVCGHFVLPQAAWWELYYTPMEQRIPIIAQRYGRDPVAAEVITGARAEIEVCRRHGHSYGYLFAVARRS